MEPLSFKLTVSHLYAVADPEISEGGGKKYEI